jgi:hypothetical protein
MVVRAERLQLSIPEQPWIVVMGLNMIGHCSCAYFPSVHAHDAQGVLAQLCLCSFPPTLGAMQAHRYI